MSTDDQASLSEFMTSADLRETEDDEKDEKPNWKPLGDDETDTGALDKCPRCGSRVLSDFSRVFGNNDDELENGCVNCATYREISGLDRYGGGPQ